MRGRGKKLAIAIGATVAIAAALLAFGLGWWRRPSLVERLAKPRWRVDALRRLLETNDIAVLPPGTLSGQQEVRTDYVQGTDRSGRRIAVVMVTYPMPSASTGSHSFVFDESGRCLLDSKDGRGLTGPGLWDITGDGWLEKIVCFGKAPTLTSPAMVKRLQVFSLRLEGPVKLLDVLYNLQEDPLCERYLVATLNREAPGHSTIELFHAPDEGIKFIWSHEREAFTVTGKPSDDWEVVFPKNGGRSPGTAPRNGGE